MWYSANLLLKSLHANASGDQESLWEESIILVAADSEEAALQLAEGIGRSKEHEYVSASGDLVKWQFERVERVYGILDESISSGTEVFSRFLREREVESILTPFPD